MEEVINKPKKVKWLPEPAEKNYPGAEAYLQLLCTAKAARKLVEQLRQAEVVEFAAKDILRASGLPMSEVKAFDWKIQSNEVERGDALSPILLVRRGKGRHVLVADGFHRLCAVFANDHKARVFCKIV